MKLLTVLALASSYAGALHATTIGCADPSFPRTVAGAIRIESDSGQFAVVLPEKYKGLSFDSASLKVSGKDGALVVVPLKTHLTSQTDPDCPRCLLAIVRTERSDFGLSVEANYGGACTWVLTSPISE
jgi:hypothetical protein